MLAIPTLPSLGRLCFALILFFFFFKFSWVVIERVVVIGRPGDVEAYCAHLRIDLGTVFARTDFKISPCSEHPAAVEGLGFRV